MKHAWRRFLRPLPSGTRLVLAVLGAGYGLALLGGLSGSFNAYAWLALDAGEVWRGQVWRVLTYSLLPAGPADFVLNGLLLAWLSSWMEEIWRPFELWGYMLISSAGAGLAKVALTPHSSSLLVGTGAVVMGLLVAVSLLLGHKRVLMMGVWEMSARTCALIMGTLGVVLTLPCAGLVNTFILTMGAVTGWLYLIIRFRTIRLQASRPLPNQRMSRLEL